MKKWIFLVMMMASIISSAWGQARQWGYHAGASVQLSELNGANAVLGGMAAGVSNGRLLLDFYGLRELQPGLTPTYRSTLEEYGLQVAYLHPATSRLNLIFGLKAGFGQAGLEAACGAVSEGRQEEDFRAISPEVGFEFPLSRRLSLAYASGYRWLWGAENIEDVSCGSFSSLYTALSLRIGFFPGR